ncbi:MAG: hypothetical protein ACM3WU_08950 [Bacillota bacterium]
MLFEPYLSPDMDGFAQIPPSGKLLYVMAQARPAGSLSDLARCSGIDERNAFHLAVLLRKHKWMKMERRGNRSIPIPIIPRPEDQRRARLLQKCYEVSQYKGEFLLRAFQDVAIVTEGAVYNARPEFLKHPVTEEKLELDIFCPETQDAWELHGFQHFGPTKIQPSKDKAKEQQANDLIKLGRSLMNGVHVEVMTYKDLSLDGVLKRMPEHLPRRPIDRSSVYVRTLERLATSYRQWAARTEAELRAQQAEEDSVSAIIPAMR